MTATNTFVSTARTGGPWGTIDLLTAAFVGVVFGVVYWGWDAAYAPLSTALSTVAGPATGLLGGPWLVAGVVSALVIRRPGAALFAELLASTVEALLGNAWGWTTLLSGGLQGLGVEVALALFLYRRFGWPVAALGGALAAAFESGYELQAYYQSWPLGSQLAYLGLFALSGAAVAGLGGWLLTKALAASGAIDALPAGQEAAAASVDRQSAAADVE
jgi:energy-coupling factor transport system substrate-specific component